MTQRKKTGGALFKNDKKTEDWHGDMQGAFEVLEPIEPGKYFLNAWKNVSSSGRGYLSMTLGKKMEGRPIPTAETKPVEKNKEEEIFEDIPF